MTVRNKDKSSVAAEMSDTTVRDRKYSASSPSKGNTNSESTHNYAEGTHDGAIGDTNIITDPPPEEASSIERGR